MVVAWRCTWAAGSPITAESRHWCRLFGGWVPPGPEGLRAWSGSCRDCSLAQPDPCQLPVVTEHPPCRALPFGPAPVVSCDLATAWEVGTLIPHFTSHKRKPRAGRDMPWY